MYKWHPNDKSFIFKMFKFVSDKICLQEIKIYFILIISTGQFFLEKNGWDGLENRNCIRNWLPMYLYSTIKKKENKQFNLIPLQKKLQIVM